VRKFPRQSGTVGGKNSAMTLAPKIGLSLGELAFIGGGVVLWAKYGGLVHFDTLASAFIGCFL
jgi:hypothetical protein